MERLLWKFQHPPIDEYRISPTNQWTKWSSEQSYHTTDQENDSWRRLQLAWTTPTHSVRLNRIRSSSRNATPYEITIGHNPRLIGDMSVKIPTQEERTTQCISRINQTQEIVRKRLQDAKISQAIQSNKWRRPAPEFSVGDQVLLSTKNLPLATSYRKIAPAWLGPLTITAAYPPTDNYTLRLPNNLTGIDPKFHVELIKAYIPNDDKRFPSRKNTNPGPLPEFEYEDRYEIEKILKSKTDTKKGTIHYFIKWKGWEPENNTWEPVGNIDQEALDEFNKRTETSIPNITTVRKMNRKRKARTSRAKILD